MSRVKKCPKCKERKLNLEVGKPITLKGVKKGANALPIKWKCTNCGFSPTGG
jgi:hypothetical protein